MQYTKLTNINNNVRIFIISVNKKMTKVKTN